MAFGRAAFKAPESLPSDTASNLWPEGIKFDSC